MGDSLTTTSVVSLAIRLVLHALASKRGNSR